MFFKTKKILKEGIKNFLSQKAIALGNIFVLTLTIFIFGATLFVKDFALFLENYLQQKGEVSIYFKEKVTEDQIFNLKKELSQKFPEVSIEYFSKEMSLEKFKQRHKENYVLMEALKEFDNPFSPYLKIKAKDPQIFEKISSFLENSEWKDSIERIDFLSRKEFIEKIFKFADFAKKLLISLSLIFVLTSTIITFNSIRLSILNSAEEIKIQKLIGADNFLVRGPFLFQSFLWGFFSTILAFLLLYLSINFLSQKLVFFSEQFNLQKLFFEKMSTIFGAQFLFSLFLTFFSSYFSVSRHLKT